MTANQKILYLNLSRIGFCITENSVHTLISILLDHLEEHFYLGIPDLILNIDVIFYLEEHVTQ